MTGVIVALLLAFIAGIFFHGWLTDRLVKDEQKPVGKQRMRRLTILDPPETDTVRVIRRERNTND